MPTYRIITPQDKEVVKRAIDQLKEGVRFDVKIIRHRPKRSVPQNNTYWMWIGCIHNETGEDQDTIHEVLKAMFLGRESREALGMSIEQSRSTAKLSTAEFTAYMDKVQAWAATELAIRLPNPEDLAWAEFYEQYGERYG